MLDASAGSSDADVEKYMSEYRILSVRQRVLSNELQDIQGQIMQVIGDMRSSFFLSCHSELILMQAEKRVQSGAIVREHMHKELLGAEERMRLLQQEIALIKVQVSILMQPCHCRCDASDDKVFQICTQDEKVADASRSINDLQQRRSLVESSLQVGSACAGLCILFLIFAVAVGGVRN